MGQCRPYPALSLIALHIDKRHSDTCKSYILHAFVE